VPPLENSTPQKKTVVFDENISEKTHDGSLVIDNEDGAARMFVKATFDFPSENERELELKRGDFVEVLNDLDDEWWFGKIMVPKNDGTLEENGQQGFFPGAYVEKIEEWV